MDQGENPPPYGMDPGGPQDPGSMLPDQLESLNLEQQDDHYYRVNMWHHSYTLPETGFHSANNSQPSSRTGYEDPMEDSASFRGGQRSMANSLHDLDSQARTGKLTY